MPTDVSTAFPAVELLPSSVLTITLSDAGAKITTLNVHGDQADPGGSTTPTTVPLENYLPIFAYGVEV